MEPNARKELCSASSNAATHLLLPPLARLAVLLDLDGTLLDLAPVPSAVEVPNGLADLLDRLAARLGGALAVISGRPVEQVAALLPRLGITIIGEHGAAICRRPGLPLERTALPEVPARWRAAARDLAAAHPGVLLEEKQHGFVLHYRGAEDAEAALHAGLDNLVAMSNGAFTIVPTVMGWELRPTGANKGTAVRTLLDRPPFAGRVPLFIGDDVTDEDAISAARQLGGFGFRVAPTFGDAAGVRAWLRSLLTAGESDEQGARCAGL